MKGEKTLLSELNHSVNSIGIIKTIEVLKQGRHRELNDIHINFVYTEVNKALDIQFDRLNDKHSRDDVRKVAIGFYFYFCCGVFGYKFKKVCEGIPLKITIRVLYMYCGLIKNANIIKPKNEIDRLVAKHITGLERKFIDYKKLNHTDGNQ